MTTKPYVYFDDTDEPCWMAVRFGAAQDFDTWREAYDFARFMATPKWGRQYLGEEF